MAKGGQAARESEEGGIVVTVRPSRNVLYGGADIDLSTHLEAIGHDVADAFKKMIKAVEKSMPDEFRVQLSLKLEGKTNWVVAEAKAEGGIEVEGTWKRAEKPASSTMSKA
jgi:hypothetical protein